MAPCASTTRRYYGSPPPNPWSVLGEGLQDIAVWNMQRKEQDRIRKRQEEADRITAELRDLELYDRGYRRIQPGTPQQREVGRDVLRSRGVELPSFGAALRDVAIPRHLGGYADPAAAPRVASTNPPPPAAGGSRESANLPTLGSFLRDDNDKPAPVVAPPPRTGAGAALRGEASPITGLLRATREPTASTAPRYEHVTGSWYRDREGTPEARARRETSEETARKVENLRRVLAPLGAKVAGYAPIMAEDPVLGRELVAGALDTPAVPVLKGTGGREFPDTEEGRRAWEQWERTHSPDRYRGPQPRGEVDPQGRSRGQRTDLRRVATQRIENMAKAGAPAEQIHQVMTLNFPEFAGTWTSDDVTAAVQGIQSGQTSERRGAVVQRIGRKPINELQEDVVDALADGLTPEEIFEEMRAAGQSEQAIAAARSYLSGADLR